MCFLIFDLLNIEEYRRLQKLLVACTLVETLTLNQLLMGSRDIYAIFCLQIFEQWRAVDLGEMKYFQ